VTDTGDNPLARGALNEVISNVAVGEDTHRDARSRKIDNESDGHPDLQLPPQAQPSGQFFP